MGRFGITEILILLVIALVFFGGSRIAGIGKGLGEGIRNFKKGLKDDDDESAKGEDGGAKAADGSSSASSGSANKA